MRRPVPATRTLLRLATIALVMLLRFALPGQGDASVPPSAFTPPPPLRACQVRIGSSSGLTINLLLKAGVVWSRVGTLASLVVELVKS